MEIIRVAKNKKNGLAHGFTLVEFGSGDCNGQEEQNEKSERKETK